MENKDYRLEQLERKLRINETNGRRTLEWELTAEQREYVENLGYNLENILYRFKTRQFKDIRSKPDLIKEIHYASKRKKWMMKKPLTDEEVRILDNYNIKYTPVKFRIYLKRQVK